jgi:D-3-phosphoglycerate dehydrogenase
MTRPFRIGLTRDFLKPDGTVGIGDIKLDQLDAYPWAEWEFLAEDATVLRPDQIRGYDALGVLAPRITAETLQGADRLSIVARYGVGYDSVDVAACTANDIALTITPDGVRRPMASSVVMFMLALTHRVFDQDRAIRAGIGWETKLDLMGWGLTGRTLGIIGLGNIGSDVARLAKPWEMRMIASDPVATPEHAASLGVELVELDELMEDSDYVAVVCALTPGTRGMIDERRIGLMKPGAFLINCARGPIVDQGALYRALVDRNIRGAALDVFEKEPIDPNDPILKLENVIVTPHAIGWTDEWVASTANSVLNGILAVAHGNNPGFVVNKEVLDRDGFQSKLRRYAEERSS